VTNTGFAGESWEIHSDRPVIQNHLDTDDFDYREAEDCSVVKVGNIYHMWYTGNGQPSGENNPSFLSRIGYATSTDGENWIKQNNGNPVISFFTIYQVDGIVFRIDYAHVSRPRVVSIESGFRIYYMKEEYTDGVFIPETIWTATSTDGINWENHVSLGIETEIFSVMYDSGKYHLWNDKDGTIEYFVGNGLSSFAKNGLVDLKADDANTWDNNSIRLGCVIKIPDGFKMYYLGNFSNYGDGAVISAIGVATSTDGKKWNKSSDNPVFHNGGIQGISNSSVVFPWVLIDDVYNKMYYTTIRNDINNMDANIDSMGLAREKIKDINNDDKFDLKDIIYGLQILTGVKK
jgi:predicted GH43/DUF377 family glycosyl hydrolase